MKPFSILRFQWLALILPLLPFLASAQTSDYLEKVKLDGKIINNWTGEGVPGVSIYIESLKRGTTTDEQGNYELTLNKGTYTIRFSRVGLKTENRFVDLINDTRVNLTMTEETYNLEEVSVFAERLDANVQKPDMGKNIISTKELTAIPSFMGEADVVKSLMFLPGVQTVGEGASGFNVRGGGVDQNLILQDGGYIFNSSHVFGFFSTFNPVMVNKATLYKSALPSRYGGRLSSVLDVELKEGDYNDYEINGGIGLVSSKLSLEGPIVKNKLSAIVSARASYSDWLLGFAHNPDVKNSSAGFYDVNVKVGYRMNENNKFTYSAYRSHDNFALASDTAFSWQTMNHVLQWTHSFNEKIFVVSDLVAGAYEYSISDAHGINSFDIQSRINYKTARTNFIYDPNEELQISFGGEVNLYDFSPGDRKPLTEESGVMPLKLEDEQSTEFSAYGETEYSLTEKITARAGVRFTGFSNVGEGTDYIYSGDSRRNENIVDTVYYSKGEPIARYNGIEPRVSLNYELTETSSLKASYNRTRQYLHLITNTAAVTPVDLWKTSNKYIQPETADQFSVGYFRNLRNNSIEASVETYYKTADNIVDFKDGTILLMNENIESALINGTSEAYGVETFLNKKTGRLTGWASYTWSRIFRKVDGEFEDEKVNNGEKYPANNDKPHNVNLAVNYKKNPLVQFAANFTYSTGRPATVPLSLYDVSNQTNVFNFSGRNKGRIPDYHRLDLAVTLNSKPRMERKWSLSWTFAVYNVYGRKNAYSVFYENVYGSPPKAYKLSVLGSAFPSVTLNFKY
jgi:hypothetical protein